MYANDPLLNTAELSVAQKWSEYGTTVPRYFFTRSGWFWPGSQNAQKMIPSWASFSLYVGALETLSMTSERPRGISSCSTSVTKPYLYSRFASSSIVCVDVLTGYLPGRGQRDRRCRRR